MKIDMPKNTWVSDIAVDFAREGYFSGALMAQITFAGGACPGLDFVTELVAKLEKAPLPKGRKIVRLKGLFDPRDMDVHALVRSLRSYGYNVQAIVKDNFSAPWLTELSWCILRIEKPAALVVANEVWYYPIEGQPLVEPMLPPKTGYLYLAKGRGTLETIKFVSESPNIWNLL